jgi:hypothetical protein
MALGGGGPRSPYYQIPVHFSLKTFLPLFRREIRPAAAASSSAGSRPHLPHNRCVRVRAAAACARWVLSIWDMRRTA